MPRQQQLKKIERRDGRAAKWGVSIPQRNGRARRAFYRSPAERDAEFNRLRKVLMEEGTSATSVSAADVAMIHALRSILPPGVDPREAARYYVAHCLPDTTTTNRDAVRGFLKKQQLARVSQDHLRHLEVALGRLLEKIGAERLVSAVSMADMQNALSSLHYQPNTVDGYQKNWRSFFNWCVKMRFCHASPMAAIDRVAIPESEPESMPVADVRKLFAAALDRVPQIAPVLALSFFAGMRSSAIRRLERADIDFVQRGIRHQGAKTKTKRRFFVQGFEPNLWAWLAPWEPLEVLPSWPSSTFIKLREKAYRAAGVEFPHNAGRHCFCTYHVALLGSADRTATLLTHRGSVATLYDHYRGNAVQEDAQAYFQIMP